MTTWPLSVDKARLVGDNASSPNPTNALSDEAYFFLQRAHCLAKINGLFIIFNSVGIYFIAHDPKAFA